MTEENRQKARAEFLIVCQHCQGRFKTYLTRLQLKKYIKDIDKEQRKIDKAYRRPKA